MSKSSWFIPSDCAFPSVHELAGRPGVDVLGAGLLRVTGADRRGRGNRDDEGGRLHCAARLRYPIATLAKLGRAPWWSVSR